MYVIVCVCDPKHRKIPIFYIDSIFFYHQSTTQTVVCHTTWTARTAPTWTKCSKSRMCLHQNWEERTALNFVLREFLLCFVWFCGYFCVAYWINYTNIDTKGYLNENIYDNKAAFTSKLYSSISMNMYKSCWCNKTLNK